MCLSVTNGCLSARVDLLYLPWWPVGLESVGRGCEEHIRGASGAGTNRFRTVRPREQVNKGAFERAWEDRMTAPVREENAQVSCKACQTKQAPSHAHMLTCITTNESCLIPNEHVEPSRSFMWALGSLWEGCKHADKYPSTYAVPGLCAAHGSNGMLGFQWKRVECLWCEWSTSFKPTSLLKRVDVLQGHKLLERDNQRESVHQEIPCIIWLGMCWLWYQVLEPTELTRYKAHSAHDTSLVCIPSTIMY